MFEELRKVFKVISGGQTGADILGVKTAKRFGIPTGGTIGIRPDGKFQTEAFNYRDEYVPEFDDHIDRSVFGFSLDKDNYRNYPFRTRQNVLNSDGTVYFKTPADTTGYLATLRNAKELNKPFLENPATSDDLIKFIQDNNIKTLNIAGNRGSTFADIAKPTEDLLNETFTKLGYAPKDVVNSAQPNPIKQHVAKVFHEPIVETEAEEIARKMNQSREAIAANKEIGVNYIPKNPDDKWLNPTGETSLINIDKGNNTTIEELAKEMLEDAPKAEEPLENKFIGALLDAED